MPFTASHVAAVLPLRRQRWLPMSGLVVGAMSPDLEYLFQLGTNRTISHQPAGILVMDLPMALAALLVARLAAPGLAALVPSRWSATASRLAAWRPPWSSPAQVAALVAAIVVGAISHIAIDEFTHASGWGVQQIPALRQTVTLAGISYPIYRWLQYGLSVLGLIAVAATVLVEVVRIEGRRLRSGPALIELEKLLAIGAAGIAVAATAAAQTVVSVDHLGPNRATAVALVITVWRSAALLLVGIGLAAGAAEMLWRAPEDQDATFPP